ncbi:hypothetical protein PSTG_15061 [Puccinia striiformis f. sp. tritici PST-78]|uniref:Uncharacterized protein n=1 Tax=Puccinia striiformis f. sp. tritici PST-78 TaxID=1165861 RepID=A0A0L0UWZ4_9BASI|nr:hypothetical protein PSTG_15061 [Puccinia striiformis f. sp. tritici PST-78]
MERAIVFVMIRLAPGFTSSDWIALFDSEFSESQSGRVLPNAGEISELTVNVKPICNQEDEIRRNWLCGRDSNSLRHDICWPDLLETKPAVDGTPLVIHTNLVTW